MKNTYYLYILIYVYIGTYNTYSVYLIINED